MIYKYSYKHSFKPKVVAIAIYIILTIDGNHKIHLEIERQKDVCL